MGWNRDRLLLLAVAAGATFSAGEEDEEAAEESARVRMRLAVDDLIFAKGRQALVGR